MPPTYTRQHGRRDAGTDNLIGPGQRVSIDGGIHSSKNIVAMILAIALFIVVLIVYQYIAITMARREEEEKKRPRHKRRSSNAQPNVSKFQKLFDSLRRLFSSFRCRVPTSNRPVPNIYSTGSMEALLKLTPRRPPPKGRSFLGLSCLSRRKQAQSTKRRPLQPPRPLLLSSESSYMPRSPIDEKTQEILRSPAAFADFSDPVRNMNFVRWQNEVERRKERDEIWRQEEPLNAPGRPVVAAVAPLSFRKKKASKLLREGDDAEYEWAPPSPEHVIYPSREPIAPAAQPSASKHSYSSSFSIYSAYSPYSHKHLSSIEEEEPEPSTPRSFFEIDDEDGDKQQVRKKKMRIRFPSRSAAKKSLQKDTDVFTIGSVSSSEDSGDELER